MSVIDAIRMHRGKIAAAIGTAVSVGAASAGPGFYNLSNHSLYWSVSPFVTDLALIFQGSFTDLIVGLIGPLIALAVLGFFTGLFDGIVSKIRM